MLPRRTDIKAVWVTTAWLALTPCPCSFCQTGPAAAPQAAVPALAVTSVKPNPKADHWRLNLTQDGWSGMGVTLRWILGEAYGTGNQDKIDGFPQWGDSARWDIEGKVDEADAPTFAKLPYSQKRLVLQNLLADRFKLAVHYDSLVKPVYVLTVAKGGPKLKETTPDELPAGLKKESALISGSGRGQFKAINLPIAALASFMTSWTGRNVVDKTGVTGRYDIKLAWSPDSDFGPGHAAANYGQSPLMPPAPTGPSIFTAVKEQLGLKLEPDKAPVQVLVIDHVEEPAPN
jgi:uncharacterized protein (TIGR03435 family)